MLPLLASALCLAFVAYLFRVDAKAGDNVSKAVWIPIIWMFLAGSRYVSQWLQLGSYLEALDIYSEGSPLDRAVFAILIAIGVGILVYRRPAWGRILTRNKLIWAYFLIGLVSIIWSPFPLLSFKRWFKAIGNVIMVLVILTEKEPYVAAGVVLRRLAILTLPLSVVFLKYYPDLGRAYHHDGSLLITGVANGKNGLGQLCLLAGTYFTWSFLYRSGRPLQLRLPFRISMEVVFLLLAAWLLTMADSATSLACLLLAVSLFALSRVPSIARSPRRLVSVAFMTALLVAGLEMTLDVSSMVIAGLNRDPSLTTRVPMWEELLSVAGNPLLGTGYEVFWASEAGRQMSDVWSVGQAHNGYIELYLNLGAVGIAVIIAGLVSGILKVRRQLLLDYPSAVLRLCCIVIVALYNWTEATFAGVNNMWLLFLLGTMDPPGELGAATPIRRPEPIKPEKTLSPLAASPSRVRQIPGRDRAAVARSISRPVR